MTIVQTFVQFAVHVHTTQRGRCLYLYCSGEFTDLQTHTDCVEHILVVFLLTQRLLSHCHCSHQQCVYYSVSRLSSVSLIVCVSRHSSVSLTLCMRRVFRYARRVSICAECGEYRADSVKQWGVDLLLLLGFGFLWFYYISLLV